MKTHKIEVGGSFFEEFATSNALLVDKTEFINAVVENGDKVLLITRPRRWGKTLNMTMCEYFFSIPVKKNGSIDTTEVSKRQDVFSKMKIGCHPHIIQEHLGKVPTIFVSFKGIKGSTYEIIEMGVRDLIYMLYARHDYLINSDNLSERQKTLFKKFITKEFDLSELQNSLFYLSEMLHTHFGEKVIILIDEYDTPLNDWYAKQLEQDSYVNEDIGYVQDVLELFKGIFGSSLKDNIYLKKGVVTGILRIAKASLFSGLNNLGEDSILDNHYSKYFGFTEDEVNNLLCSTGMSDHPEILSSLKSWYNGYNIGGITIYNPWSIMNFLKSKGDFKAYWVGTASTTLIENALMVDKFQEDVQALIEGKTVEMVADPKMVFKDIKSSSNALYNLLLFSGYLTAERVENAKGGTYACDVRVPNREILEIFEISVMQWIRHKFNIQINEYNSFINDLLQGHILEFTQKLKEYLSVSASFYATGTKNAELFYNGFMIGLISSVSSRYFVETEKESGSGRADLILIPKETARYNNALILEFKSAKPDENLKSVSQKALEQIEAKKYETKIHAHNNISKIIKIGLAFSGKNVEVSF